MAKKVKPVVSKLGDTDTPVGNFGPSDLDNVDPIDVAPQNNLPHPSTYLDDPQEFIDAFNKEAAAQGVTDSNLAIALDVIKTILLIVE